MNALEIRKKVQALLGAKEDGKISLDKGGETETAFRALAVAPEDLPWPPSSAPAKLPPTPLTWPKESEASVFYGARPSLTQIAVPYPMRMNYDGSWHAIKTITCHVKVAESLRRCLTAILAHYGSPEAIKAVGMDVYDGCYNDRNVRGSSSRKSMHAYGAAIDLDADHNPLGASTWKIPKEVVDIFKAEGWRWGGEYSGRKDAMHFEACR